MNKKKISIEDVRKILSETQKTLNELKTMEDKIMDEISQNNDELNMIMLIRSLKNLAQEMHEKCDEFSEIVEPIAKTNREYAVDFNFAKQEFEILKLRTNGNANLFIMNKNISDHDKKMKEQTKKIEEHDKNILNIMGIFLAIFSLIGVNFSFFSKFDSVNVNEWIYLTIAINISLVLAIKFIFSSIKHLFINDK